MPSNLFSRAASSASRPLRARETRKPYIDSPASKVRRIKRSSSATNIWGGCVIVVFERLSTGARLEWDGLEPVRPHFIYMDRLTAFEKRARLLSVDGLAGI